MQGNPQVIARLQLALKEELTAINQYFLHAEMCENWKYDKLGKFIKMQSIDEMKHAEEIIERILFLDGTPSLTELMTLNIGQNVKAQLENDLKLELGAVAMYNESVRIARDEGDNASRELFERLLKAKVNVTRAQFDAASGFVDRALEQRVASLAFGDSAAFRRSTKYDDQLATALDYLKRSGNQRTLLALAEPKK